MRRLFPLIALLTSCVVLPAHIHPLPNRHEWPSEPTVGTDVPEYLDDVQEAVRAWRWGRYVEGASKADIYFVQGALQSGGVYGTAGRDPQNSARCRIEIRVQTGAVIAHELGHCYGIGHSTDRHSIMWPVAREPWSTIGPIQSITPEDRRLLGRLTGG